MLLLIINSLRLKRWNFQKFTRFFVKKSKKINFFIASLNSGEKVNSVFWNPNFCWIFDQRVSTRVGQSASCFRFLLRDILGFPGYDEANSCGFDLITFCKPIGEYLLHSHRELGYGKVCLFGKELKAAVLHRNTALQCQHLVFDSLEGP